tara:strand:- start:283 stop:798 length:516 start_codon:yes stop_codon:yes gene_type:complete
MLKSITIKGKHNQDKLFNASKPHKRDSVANIDKKWFERKHQIELVNSLYLNITHQIEKLGTDELKKKLRSYKVQDDKRSNYNEKLFVTSHGVLEQLVMCKLKCFYCECNLSLLYQDVRQNDQWTLDRIDNTLGHNYNNIVISCLKCNLKRRTMDMNTFKQYRVVNVKKQNS